ncbi:MAG: 5-formyltetrahydrofolate cyclo-ligase [Candidatus Omnitrophota bacterium]|nr:5-formyltetrahydrofolate cyclo-ligase [Candidatus Omnitrophota bacterium]
MSQNVNIIRQRKGQIRKEIIRRLRDQAPSLRERRSRKIQEKLLSCEEFRDSRTVMSYVSLPSEVDTRYFNKEALKQGKRVAVPYIESDNTKIRASEFTTIESLEEGPFGIFQPKDGLVRVISLKEIDLIVVPAIAFDRSNMRLGRGKGYYDGFLAEEDLASSTAIGLAFHFQMVEQLPSDPHDRPVSMVLTD